MPYVREVISSKLLPDVSPGTRIDNLFIESNLRLKKWLIYGSYNPHVM